MGAFSLFENAVAAWGDRTAVRCGARRQTYRELDAAAAAFAGHLASLGLAPGDRVAVFMQNGLLYPAVLMGAFRGGYVAVPINAKLHPREVGYIVENAAAKAIVVDFDALEGVTAAAPSLRAGDFIVAGTAAAPGSLDATLRLGAASSAVPAECNADGPGVAVLHFGHDRTTKRRYAEPPQSHRYGGELPRGHLFVPPRR